MSPSEARRRQVLYKRARRRWRESNPERGFALDHRAVYLAPEAIRPALAEDSQ